VILSAKKDGKDIKSNHFKQREETRGADLGRHQINNYEAISLLI
jgi:hypothetical protein